MHAAINAALRFYRESGQIYSAIAENLLPIGLEDELDVTVAEQHVASLATVILKRLVRDDIHRISTIHAANPNEGRRPADRRINAWAVQNSRTEQVLVHQCR